MSSKWNLGKLRGSIVKYQNYYKFFVQYDNQTHTKNFAFSQFNTEKDVYESAKNYQIKFNEEHDISINNWRKIDDHIEIKVNYQGESLITKVDIESFEKINQYKWYASNNAAKDKTLYVYSCINSKVTSLHRFITKEKYKIVDHINGDGLDNRKANLRDGSGRTNQNNRILSILNKTGHNSIYFRKNKKQYELSFYDCSKKRYFISSPSLNFIKLVQSKIYNITNNNNGIRKEGTIHENIISKDIIQPIVNISTSQNIWKVGKVAGNLILCDFFIVLAVYINEKTFFCETEKFATELERIDSMNKLRKIQENINSNYSLSKNDWREVDGHVEMKITCKQETMITKLDKDDFLHIKDYTWCASKKKNYNAIRIEANINGINTGLISFITNNKYKYVRHIKGSLDNRRKNLKFGPSKSLFVKKTQKFKK